MFYDWVDDLDYVEPAQAWEIVKALNDYYRNGTNPIENVSKACRGIMSMMMHQIKRAEENAMAKSKAGKRSAATKFVKTDENVDSGEEVPDSVETVPTSVRTMFTSVGTVFKHNSTTETETQTETDTETQTETDTETHTQTDTSLSPPIVPRGDERALEERFNSFWESYPKKTARENAKRAYMNLKPDEKLSRTMLDALGIHKLNPQWSEERYIPSPANWIIGRRWEDDVSFAPPKSVWDTVDISTLDEGLPSGHR